MGLLQVVVGGQYGSEAKGACTAYLAKKARHWGGEVTVIRVAGPNAGHTAYDASGRKWALRQVPVAAVVDEDIELIIGAGSEIDFDVLLEEVDSLEGAGIPVRNRLIVDNQATLVTGDHKISEISGAHLVEKIGSTGKGIGAARADRLMRKAEVAADDTRFPDNKIQVEDQTWLHLYGLSQSNGHATIIEGTQGYGLGLHAGHYPQCTSSDCRAVDFCAMAGVDPAWYGRYEPWVVLRTYPIRVAGNSGPLKGETTWDALGFEPEYTTVTKKVRRVGEWDPALAREAVLANGGPSRVKISLSMADYIVPEIHGLSTAQLSNPGETAKYRDAIHRMHDLVDRVQADTGARVRLVGTGPKTFIEVA